MLRRCQLPADDEDHMPPAEKPQPTAADVAALRAWIAAGAPFTGVVDGLVPVPGNDHPPAAADGKRERGDDDDDREREQGPPAAAADALAALHAELVHAAPI